MAQENELIRRAEDLQSRAERSGDVTHTGFLTPAEVYELRQWASWRSDCRVAFFGDRQQYDRQVAFFMPAWYADDAPPFCDYIKAIKVTAGFGEPSHRDYLGAALAIGIKREWVGDIIIDKNVAHILCLNSVAQSILLELDHVGRCGVKCEEVPLDDAPAANKKCRLVTFTAASERFDTVVGAMFGMSRSAAARLIEAKAASLNYSVCEKVSTVVKPGDVISLKGHGKGELYERGGTSRKGRTFLTAKVYE